MPAPGTTETELLVEPHGRHVDGRHGQGKGMEVSGLQRSNCGFHQISPEAVALMASYLPSRRVLAFDPVAALRHE